MIKTLTKIPRVLPEVRWKLVDETALHWLRVMDFPAPPIPINKIVEIHVKKNLWYKEEGKLYGPEGRTTKIDMEDNNFFFGIQIATDIGNGYSKKTIKRKQNWTLAHEIGHIFLHGDFIVDTISKKYLHDDCYNNMEVEANKFAERVLLPDYVFESVDDLDPVLLAEKCFVSLEAAQKRIDKLNQKFIQNIWDRSRDSNIVMFPNVGYAFTEQNEDYINEIFNNEAASTVETEEKMNWTESIEKELDAIQGIDLTEHGQFVYCPFCGHAEFSKHATFCMECGFPIRNICLNNEVYSEGNCKVSNVPKAKFCECCGEKTLIGKILGKFSLKELEEMYNSNHTDSKSNNRTIDISDDDLPF